MRDLRGRFLRAHYVSATPEFLWRCLITDRLPFSFVDQVVLCVVDEYDEFVKERSLRGHMIASFWKPAAGLLESIHARGIPFLCMSAESPHRNSRAAHWLSFLGSDVDTCEPVASTYGNYVPAIRPVPIPVEDLGVQAADAELTRLLGDLERQLNELVATVSSGSVQYIRIESILPQMGAIAAGRAKTLYVLSRNGKRTGVLVTGAMRAIIRRMRRTIRHRLLIFEDMIPDQQLVMPGAKAPGDASILDQEHCKYSAELHNKADHVVTIVEERTGEPGVIFCRYADVAEALAARLQERGLSGAVVHGQVDPVERTQRTAGFAEGKQEFLVVTRKLGGRGFDLPQAKYAVFYSPKEDADVMWQEMLRIRSLKAAPKCAYILYYQGTAEQRKLDRLKVQMRERPDGFLVD
jgi:hypothetical protein